MRPDHKQVMQFHLGYGNRRRRKPPNLQHDPMKIQNEETFPTKRELLRNPAARTNRTTTLVMICDGPARVRRPMQNARQKLQICIVAVAQNNPLRRETRKAHCSTGAGTQRHRKCTVNEKKTTASDTDSQRDTYVCSLTPGTYMRPNARQQHRQTAPRL